MPFDGLPTCIEYARANDGELPEFLEFASENGVLGSNLNLGDDPQMVSPAIEAIYVLGWLVVALAVYLAVFGACLGSVFLR